jgi:hypothetical protein
MNTNDRLFKEPTGLIPRKSKFSNITGTSPKDFGIDTTRLERLKSDLATLETVKLPDAEKYLALHEGYLAENIQRLAANFGFFDPRNVDIERERVAKGKAEVKKLKEVEIPNKKAEIVDEQKLINMQLDKAIEALRESAKTDPSALAALKELEAQRAAISGSKTKLIVFAVVGVVLLIIGTIIFIKIRKKSKAAATA